MQLIRKQMFRWAFCSGRLETGAVSSTSASGSEATKIEEAPVHLRPYDGKKYEIPSTKLKVTTGYSFLDVEPVPRAKIMKICYIVLDKMKVLPEAALYRIYTEEKIKYIMRMTDQTEDVQVLEQELGFESIEFFIQCLHGEIRLADIMKEKKPWEITDGEQSYEFLKHKRPEAKHIPNQRPPREQQKFIG